MLQDTPLQPVWHLHSPVSPAHRPCPEHMLIISHVLPHLPATKYSFSLQYWQLQSVLFWQLLLQLLDPSCPPELDAPILFAPSPRARRITKMASLRTSLRTPAHIQRSAQWLEEGEGIRGEENVYQDGHHVKSIAGVSFDSVRRFYLLRTTCMRL